MNWTQYNNLQHARWPRLCNMLWGPVLQYVNALKMLCVLGSMGLYQTAGCFSHSNLSEWWFLLDSSFLGNCRLERFSGWIRNAAILWELFAFHFKKNWTVLISFHWLADLQKPPFYHKCIPYTLYIIMCPRSLITGTFLPSLCAWSISFLTSRAYFSPSSGVASPWNIPL